MSQYDFDPKTFPTEFTTILDCRCEWTVIPSTGSERRIALYLNGINDPFQNHIDLLRLIADKGYDVYALNLPGHGRSEKLTGLSWSELVQLVTTFCTQKELTDITIIGYSLGGGIALNLMQKHHQLLRAVKLIAPLCLPINLIPHDIFKITRFGLDFLLKRFALANTRPTLFPTNPFSIVRDYFPLLANYKFSLGTNHIPLKVLLLHDDELLSSVAARQALAAIPNCQIKIVAGDHDIYFLNPPQLNLLVDSLF